MMLIEIITPPWVRDSSFPRVYKMIDHVWASTERVNRVGHGDKMHTMFLLSGDHDDLYMIVLENDRRSFIRGDATAHSTMKIACETVPELKVDLC